MKKLPAFLAWRFMRIMDFSLSRYSLTYFSARLNCSLRTVLRFFLRVRAAVARRALISSRVFLFLRRDSGTGAGAPDVFALGIVIGLDCLDKCEGQEEHVECKACMAKTSIP